VEVGLSSLLGILYVRADAGRLASLLERAGELVSNPDSSAGKEQVVGWLRDLIPEFRHGETGKTLDDRM
jgi:hypothetical protein